MRPQLSFLRQSRGFLRFLGIANRPACACRSPRAERFWGEPAVTRCCTCPSPWEALARRNSLFAKLLLYEISTSRKLEIQTQLAG
jgi:hypothetical protein